jgi:hypothetical protein
MAKAILTVTSDLSELTAALTELGKKYPDALHEALEAKLQVLERQIKTNWATMIPWGAHSQYVYDSIGYNIKYGKNKIDSVGMVGVFLVDSVGAKHGKNTRSKKGYAQIKAPQLAYWAEFGFKPKGGTYVEGTPYMSNAFHATIDEQDEAFADTLAYLLDLRL